MSQRWYVATTKPNGELLAARELRKQGYGVYVAKTFIPQKVGLKAVPEGVIRFTGYIFVSFDKDIQEHSRIKNTRGISQLLVDGDDQPEPMWPGIIEKLRGIEDEDFDKARVSAELTERTDLQYGDEVLVDDTTHRCYGQKGFYFGCKGKTHFVLIGAARVPVDPFGLRKIEKPKKPKAEKPKKKKKGRKS